MTEKEAIAELKNIFINALEYQDIRTQRDFINAFEYRDNRTQIAFDMAIESLEKQIPKKPAHDFRGLYDFCPVCYKNNRHIMVSIPDNVPKIKYNFCPYCGQAVDWSEE